MFFRNADLTGRDLVVGKVCGPFGEKVYLAYVKLVSLSAEEVATLMRQRADSDARSLQGSIDGISYFFSNEYALPSSYSSSSNRSGTRRWASSSGRSTTAR